LENELQIPVSHGGSSLRSLIASAMNLEQRARPARLRA